MGTPLQVTLCFSLAALKILLIFSLWHLIMIVLVWSSLCPSGLGLSVLPGLVCLFPSSNQGSFLSLFFEIDFQFVVLSSPSSTPMMQMLVCLKLSQRLLTLYLFFFCFFLFVSCFDCLFFIVFQITDLILGLIYFTVDSLYSFFMTGSFLFSSSAFIFPFSLLKFSLIHLLFP